MMHATRWLVMIGAVLAVAWAGTAGASQFEASWSQSAAPTLRLAEEQPAAPGTTAASSAVFHVPTITCPTCPLRVEASVKKAPGILDVAFNGQVVTVTYNPSAVSPEAIEAAIEAGGDIAEPVEG